MVRNHFELSIDDTPYPSVPIRSSRFKNASNVEPFTDGVYDYLHRSWISTGHYNFNDEILYAFGGFSVRGNDPTSNDLNLK